jgi:nicotinate-nucleotide adenylyltransferase
MKAVYGGAFNPPHTGHLKVAQQALETVDQLILVPSFAHPDGKVMAPWSIRLELTQALAEDINRPGRVFVSKVEEQMVERPCYTYLVLRILAREHGPVRFVVGEDNRLNSWEGGAEILDPSPPPWYENSYGLACPWKTWSRHGCWLCSSGIRICICDVA